MTTALVTAVYGGYDRLRPLPAGHGFDDAVCVTDDQALAAPGWRTIVQSSPLRPRLAAKRAKTAPWEFTDADCSLWLDASFEVAGPGLRAEVDRVLEFASMAGVRHPARDCVFAEADHAAPMDKYADQPVSRQAAWYRAQGHPANGGLWANGVIARRHTPRIVRLGYAWLAEIVIWSDEDQVSLPYLLRQHAIKPSTWEVPLWESKWWAYRGHLKA